MVDYSDRLLKVKSEQKEKKEKCKVVVWLGGCGHLKRGKEYCRCCRDSVLCCVVLCWMKASIE
jgi:hypothetical protein